MDLQEAFDAGFDAVKAYVDKSFSAFERRLLKMESQLAAFPVPKDGKDADVDEVAALAAAALLPGIQKMQAEIDALNPQIEAIGGAIGEEIAQHVAKAVAAIPAPKDGIDGKDAEPVTKEQIVEAVLASDALGVAVEQYLSDNPAPAGKDGQDGMNGKDADQAIINQMVAEAVAALPPAEKGKDADPEMVASLVKEEAQRILATWERPKDGAQGEKGADGINGKDGIDAVDVMIDREGNLVFTMADGRMKNVGPVVGKDGESGKDGRNGADGVGFDDLDLVETENGVFLRFTRGDVVKDFRLPIVTDRGVFKEGSTYLKGDGVTWGGSFWIAQDETTEKPDSGKGWRLAVKKGRDGKDGGTK